MKTKVSRSASPPRRKPRQSRARHTSQALQDAFVRLLVERGYAGITIRELVAVAGTGLGSFYEYFASKEDLARVCLHLRSKALLMAVHDAVERNTGRPFREIVLAVIESQADAHREHPQEWGAHYLLERHLSGPEAYRKMYDRFVDEWVAALDAAVDLSPDCDRQEAARVSFTIMYGLFAHAHIGAGGKPDLNALSRQACTAICAYLETQRK
ncbi:TetR/AcrR family transcriptional regulator [Variovorax sp. Sphag1AA]|uniref:TetR/AcrR family transcriptional regulator n=1 Tax=Variovorax sp. Sphag1AA TaxID=2587027 RepID=UPI0016219636|nr:TetR/AcrR family transcriptional regulator [Variovorax sp. Sphag1AA]MBB3179263.1 AcrR family transcriptional regulator [Variovorax sp. Sphag1AA]